MLEQAQEIVHSFNQTYGEVLVRPEAVLPPKGMGRLPGIDGNGKMSKSLGNGIYLSDPAEVVQKKSNEYVYRSKSYSYRGPRTS